MPLCCISRDRLSSGGSGEGMAVGRQLVPLIPVDVGGEHPRPSMVSSFRTAPALPCLPWALGLLEPLSEVLGVEHAVRPPQCAPDPGDRYSRDGGLRVDLHAWDPEAVTPVFQHLQNVLTR